MSNFNMFVFKQKKNIIFLILFFVLTGIIAPVAVYAHPNAQVSIAAGCILRMYKMCETQTVVTNTECINNRGHGAKAMLNKIVLGGDIPTTKANADNTFNNSNYDVRCNAGAGTWNDKAVLAAKTMFDILNAANNVSGSNAASISSGGDAAVEFMDSYGNDDNNFVDGASAAGATANKDGANSCGVTNPGKCIANAFNGFAKLLLGFIVIIPMLYVVFITAIVRFIVGTILIWIIGISVNFISFTSLDPVRNTAVAYGWPIVRDFANIIVVVGFIVIGLATILRWQAYAAKQLLVKLIIAALLINFSLLICGVVIDVSNILMVYFFKGINPSTLAWLIKTDDINQFWTNVTNLLNLNVDPIRLIFSYAGSILYNIMGIIIYCLFIMLFLFRIMAIWILVILSPIAFVFAVFPRTKGIFDMWLNNFIQWCFIGAIGAFFLMLGEKLQDVMGTQLGKSNFGIDTMIDNLRKGGDPGTIGRYLAESFTNLFTLIIPGLFLLIGFIFSLQISAMGANAATSAGRRIGNFVKSSGTQLGKRAVSRASRETGLTQYFYNAKDALTRGGERAGILGAGHTEANILSRNRANVEDKDRQARTSALTSQQKIENLQTDAQTVSGRQDQVAFFKSLTKEEQALLSGERQMQLFNGLTEHGLVQSEVAANLSTANQNRIVRGQDHQGNAHEYSAKTVEAAMNNLASQNLLDGTQARAGNLTQAEVRQAMQNMRNNGSDLKNVIPALNGIQLRDMIRANTFNGANDGPIRAKIAKAIFDKNQADLLNYAEQVYQLQIAQANGIPAADLAVKMNNANRARFVMDATNDRYFGSDTRTKVVDALRKEGKLSTLSDPIAGVQVGGVQISQRQTDRRRRQLFAHAFRDGADAYALGNSMQTSDIAYMINNNVPVPEEAQWGGFDALVKRDDLHRINPGRQAPALANAMRFGTKRSDVEKSNYLYYMHRDLNDGAIDDYLKRNGIPPSTATNVQRVNARKQLTRIQLEQGISTMSIGQRLQINPAHLDINLVGGNNFNPGMIRSFRGSSAHITRLRNLVAPLRTRAQNAHTSHNTAEFNRLNSIITEIGRL